MPSSSRAQRENSPQPRMAPEELTFSDWPLRDRPLASFLALAITAGVIWVAVWTTHSPAAGALVGVLLGLTLWRMWLPVWYQLGAGGITQSVLGRERRIPWTAIRGHERRSDGVILLPDVGKAQLGALCGLYLHWGSQREAVLAHLDYYLTPRTRSPAGSSLGAGAERRA
jgi:hypothetical protein